MKQAISYIDAVLDVAKENCHSPQDAWAYVIEFLGKAKKELALVERQQRIDKALPGEY